MDEGRRFLLSVMLLDMRPADVLKAFTGDMTFAQRHSMLHDPMRAESHHRSHERRDVPLIAALMASVNRDGTAAHPTTDEQALAKMELLAARTARIAEANHDDLRRWWLHFEEVFKRTCDDAQHRERIRSIWRESDTTRPRLALRGLSLRLQACTMTMVD